MNNIGITTNAFANFVAPLNPVTKQPVGQENPEAKGNVLPPVLEGEENAALQNQRNTNTSEDVVSKEKEQEQNSSQADSGDNEQNQEIEEQEIIQELAARDREVRSHEQAHVNVGGVYAGAPSYSYERGPDGVNYAVAGEVPITAPNNFSDPEQALKAAEQIRSAALAPAQPSTQDLRVATQAAQMAIQARAEIAVEETRARNEESETAEQQISAQQSGQQNTLDEQINSLEPIPARGTLVDSHI